MHKALGDAVGVGLLTENVAARAHVPRFDPTADRHGGGEVQCWDQAQTRRFLAASRGHPLSDLWQVALGTGMRRGELLGLRWDEVDLDVPQLRVSRSLTVEAAIELLIGHRSWLRRNDFVDNYIATSPGPEAPHLTSIAWVDWPAAITALNTQALVCSSSEARMLRIAASLAADLPLDLGDAVTRLDTANLDLVVQALLHAGGH